MLLLGTMSIKLFVALMFFLNQEWPPQAGYEVKTCLLCMYVGYIVKGSGFTVQPSLKDGIRL